MTDEKKGIEKEVAMATLVMDAIEQNLDRIGAPVGFRIGVFSSLLIEAFRQDREACEERGLRNLDKCLTLLQAMREAPNAEAMRGVMEDTADAIGTDIVRKH